MNIIDEVTAKQIGTLIESKQAKIHAYGSKQRLPVSSKITVSVSYKSTTMNKQTFFVLKSATVGGILLGAILAQ